MLLKALAAAVLFLPLSAFGAPLRRVVVSDDTKEPLTLDPFVEFAEKNHTILQQVLEGLVRFDPDGNIVPALAESWEQTTPLRLRFHLRPGVLFHDGEPFDARAVRFSLEKYVDPATGYPGRGFFSSVERVEIVDPLTVDVVTRQPDGVLLRRLAGLITMVPPAYYARVGGAEFSRRPLGTGPFKFDHWASGQEIVLTANRDYWEKGLPKIDELAFRFIPAQDQVAALLSGAVDLVMEIPGTATLQVKSNPDTTVLKKETLYTVGASFNVARGPLSDVRFRRALNLAVNRAELIRYDLLGNGKLVSTLSLPGQVGHDPDLVPYPYDPKQAKELLRQIGVKTPVHLKTILRLPQGNRTARILAKQLEEVGIILHMETGAESDLFRKFREQDWDVGIAGMPDPTAHASFIQSILLYSKSPYSFFKSDEYDRLLEDFTSTLSLTEQEAKGRALDRYIHSQALSLFTYQRLQTYGLDRRLVFTPYMTGMPYFRSVEISTGASPRGQR